MGCEFQLPQNEAVKITVMPRAADLILAVRITPLPKLKEKHRKKHPVLNFVIPDTASGTPRRYRESILLTTFPKKCQEECGHILDEGEPFTIHIEISLYDESSGEFTPIELDPGPTPDPVLPSHVTAKGGEAIITLEKHGGNGDKLDVDWEAIKAVIEAWAKENSAVIA